MTPKQFTMISYKTLQKTTSFLEKHYGKVKQTP